MKLKPYELLVVTAQDGCIIGIFDSIESAKLACKLAKSAYTSDTFSYEKFNKNVINLDLSE